MENIKLIIAKSKSFYSRYRVIKEADNDYKSFYATELEELEKLITICDRIDNEFDNNLKSYMRIGYDLLQIRDLKLYEHAHCKNVYEFSYIHCGLSKSFTVRLISIAERFYIAEYDLIGIRFDVEPTNVSLSNNCRCDVAPTGVLLSSDFKYKDLSGFSISKLQEILPLPDLMIKEYINTASISVSDLRNLVTGLLYDIEAAKKSEEEHNAELDEWCKEIEAKYNPKQYYDFSYFKSKTKSQLLNIIMELQKTCFKK